MCATCQALIADRQEPIVCGKEQPPGGVYCERVTDWKCELCGSWYCSSCDRLQEPYSPARVGGLTRCFFCAADLSVL